MAEETELTNDHDPTKCTCRVCEYIMKLTRVLETQIKAQAEKGLKVQRPLVWLWEVYPDIVADFMSIRETSTTQDEANERLKEFLHDYQVFTCQLVLMIIGAMGKPSLDVQKRYVAMMEHMAGHGFDDARGMLDIAERLPSAASAGIILEMSHGHTPSHTGMQKEEPGADKQETMH